jgi:hypothetical protein
MVSTIRSVSVLAFLLASGTAHAASPLQCADGFTKVLDNGGEALCRRAEDVASSGLADALSRLWWDEAHCTGTARDRQAAVSQNPSGAWTVTLRFFCE